MLAFTAASPFPSFLPLSSPAPFSAQERSDCIKKAADVETEVLTFDSLPKYYTPLNNINQSKRLAEKTKKLSSENTEELCNLELATDISSGQLSLTILCED